MGQPIALRAEGLLVPEMDETRRSSFQSMEATSDDLASRGWPLEIVRPVQLAKAELGRRGIRLAWSIGQAGEELGHRDAEGQNPASGRHGSASNRRESPAAWRAEEAQQVIRSSRESCHLARQMMFSAPETYHAVSVLSQETHLVRRLGITLRAQRHELFGHRCDTRG